MVDEQIVNSTDIASLYGSSTYVVGDGNNINFNS